MKGEFIRQIFEGLYAIITKQVEYSILQPRIRWLKKVKEAESAQLKQDRFRFEEYFVYQVCAKDSLIRLLIKVKQSTFDY